MIAFNPNGKILFRKTPLAGSKLMDQEKFTFNVFYVPYGYFAGARTARL